MAKKNYVVKGEVAYAGFNEEDGKNIITLALTDERAKELIEKLEMDDSKYAGIPVKENDEGEKSFRASSKYEVAIKEDGEESDINIKDIGKGSEVEIHVGIGESTFKKKTFQVAYLKAINIIEYVPYEPFDAFAEGADITTV